jgi:hypothetical protein
MPSSHSDLEDALKADHGIAQPGASKQLHLTVRRFSCLGYDCYSQHPLFELYVQCSVAIAAQGGWRVVGVVWKVGAGFANSFVVLTLSQLKKI